MGQQDVIARRYAKGLIEAAAEAGIVDRVRDELKALADIVDPASGAVHVPEFMRLLTSPTVSLSDKIALAERIASGSGFADQTSSFLKVLIEHGRVALLPRIARAFAEQAGPLTGIYTATVHTARPLRDEQLDRLRHALTEALDARVVLHQRVEPGLLAGAKIVVGDKTIDGTVLGKLERLRERLLTESAAFVGTGDDAPSEKKK
ncbi:MAG: ATP synthase F1 subunit delta [Planctomycetaceae bacterium]|nr:ATP synthase F1 subunit delta [Planctomycetaceae bacterium]